MFESLKVALKNIEARNNKKTKQEFQMVLDKEQIDYRSFKVIHITGTNGKGSTLNYIRALLCGLGYRVGTFSSPYMIKHNDRICINGEMISDRDFLRLINQCYPIIEKYNLSMFEADVLMMLVYFKQMNIDYAVIEVGIGGRDDKTNILEGMINVITSIGYDHLKLLGPSLEDVALHKAGIIKEASHVVVGKLQKQLYPMIEQVANDKHAILHKVNVPRVTKYPYYFDYKQYKGMLLQGVGSYQVNNFLVALETCLLIEPKIDQSIIDSVTSNTYWPGRFEKVKNVYLDGAHNLDGVEALIESIELMKEGNVGIIFSALYDKEYRKMIQLLLNKNYEVIVCSFEDSRALSMEEISKIGNVQFKDTFLEAYQLADKQGYDMLVVTGSLHFISDVRRTLFQ